MIYYVSMELIFECFNHTYNYDSYSSMALFMYYTYSIDIG